MFGVAGNTCNNAFQLTMQQRHGLSEHFFLNIFFFEKVSNFGFKTSV